MSRLQHLKQLIVRLENRIDHEINGNPISKLSLDNLNDLREELATLKWCLEIVLENKESYVFSKR